MNEYPFTERVNTKIRQYEKMFADRGEYTPSDPLEFHLSHLASYWSRLVGFCRQAPSETEHWIVGDLGACVAVGSEFAQKLIGPSSPIYSLWQAYWRQTQAILYDRPVTFEAVEAASQAFDACIDELKYDPWK